MSASFWVASSCIVTHQGDRSNALCQAIFSLQSSCNNGLDVLLQFACTIAWTISLVADIRRHSTGKFWASATRSAALRCPLGSQTSAPPCPGTAVLGTQRTARPS